MSLNVTGQNGPTVHGGKYVLRNEKRTTKRRRSGVWREKKKKCNHLRTAASYLGLGSNGVQQEVPFQALPAQSLWWGAAAVVSPPQWRAPGLLTPTQVFVQAQTSLQPVKLPLPRTLAMLCLRNPQPNSPQSSGPKPDMLSVSHSMTGKNSPHKRENFQLSERAVCTPGPAQRSTEHDPPPYHHPGLFTPQSPQLYPYYPVGQHQRASLKKIFFFFFLPGAILFA